MKYVLFLNGERGLSILKKLKKKKSLKLNSVVCCQRSIKEKLKKIIDINKILYLQNINSKISFLKLKNFDTDIFIIAGYPQIFSKKVIAIPKLISINLHGGSVPNYRGGSPLNWQIINNEKNIGISILTMNSKIDGGKLIQKAKFKLKVKDDISSVHKKANKLFFHMLMKALKKIKKENLKNIFLKKKGKSKYWYQRNDSDGYLDYKDKSAFECYNFIRAITKPYLGAWIKEKIGKKKCLIRLYDSKILKKKLKINKIVINNKKIILPCKNSYIQINNYKIQSA
tara:strand:+ start:6474 stop:7325 length:852 start_codon:yes stop_codon:yes gene_type:complete